MNRHRSEMLSGLFPSVSNIFKNNINHVNPSVFLTLKFRVNYCRTQIIPIFGMILKNGLVVIDLLFLEEQLLLKMTTASINAYLICCRSFLDKQIQVCKRVYYICSMCPLRVRCHVHSGYGL